MLNYHHQYLDNEVLLCVSSCTVYWRPWASSTVCWRNLESESRSMSTRISDAQDFATRPVAGLTPVQLKHVETLKKPFAPCPRSGRGASILGALAKMLAGKKGSWLTCSWCRTGGDAPSQRYEIIWNKIKIQRSHRGQGCEKTLVPGFRAFLGAPGAELRSGRLWVSTWWHDVTCTAGHRGMRHPGFG